MTIKVAINGYGRIGRNIMRALYELDRTDEISIVAINDLGDAKSNAHLTKYDTAHGTFPGTVAVEDGDLVINGDRIKVFAERDPAKLPWKRLGAQIAVESTGLFRKRDDAAKHLAAGADGDRSVLRLHLDRRVVAVAGHIHRNIAVLGLDVDGHVLAVA